MRKELVAPSVSLFIPALMFFLLLLSGWGVYLSQRGILPSSPQPAWLHFFVSHLRLLSKIIQIGMLCSVLNAGLTLVWLLKGASTEQIDRHLKGMGMLFLLLGGSVVVFILLSQVPHLYQALIGTHGPSHQMSMKILINSYLLPVGIILLVFGLMGLVAVTAILSFAELRRRLKRTAPGATPP